MNLNESQINTAASEIITTTADLAWRGQIIDLVGHGNIAAPRGKATVELARGADLLIHEGTFDATMGSEARRKGHSTVADAARVAVEAGVGELIITHLSPRYGDTNSLRAQAREIFPRTRIARDLMRVELFHREA